jgi:hypothetical protein
LKSSVTASLFSICLVAIDIEIELIYHIIVFCMA